MAPKKPITSASVKKKTTKVVSRTRRTKNIRRTVRIKRKSAVIYARKPSILNLVIRFISQSFFALKTFQKNLFSFISGIIFSVLHALRNVVGGITHTFVKTGHRIHQGIHRSIQSIRSRLKLPKFLHKKKKKSKFKKKLSKKVVTIAKESKKELVNPFIYVFRYYPWPTLLSILFSILILASAYFVYDVAFKDLPPVSDLSARKQILTTKILDRNGQLLYRIYKDENRTLVPLSHIPPDLIHATIAIEDKSFYSHRGISLRGIIRAAYATLTGKRLEGGSTITQQLVKNTLLTPERTFKRKIREVLLAFLVEGTYSKDEILGMYFNEVAYGGSTYGAEEAAQKYFGKSVSQLSLAECAFLAGLPEAPTVYSPFGATPDLAYARQHDVLRRMVEDGYITEDMAKKAREEKLTFKPDTTDIKAPHFVMYIRSLLVKEYGEELVNQGGLEVKTTLDLPTQDKAQEIVTKEVNDLQRLRISNGAAMITNPGTGEVLAMVGSKNYFDFAHDGEVNVALRPRQPGSSIKPITYALAFSKGQNPYSTVLDEPVTFNTPGSPPYSPKNYDGKFHGNVTLREALASSFNIPAVKTLASVGISNMIDQAELMGISTWKDRSRFGLSLTLGSGEVLMYDMMQVYGTFANYGDTVQLNPILEVKNSRGEILYHNSCAIEHTDCPSERTLDPKVAYEITDTLSDNNARTPAFGPHSVLYIPNQQVAVKTGTTNNLKDNWAIGYTKDRVVATWVGNNDGTPMSYVASGITGASPIWNKIMLTQLDDKSPSAFLPPTGFNKVRICVKTGTLPCAGCPNVQEELFTPGTEPKFACDPAAFHPKSEVSIGDATNSRILDGVHVGN